MDGTLVDTEPLWMAAQRQLAGEYGHDWTEADHLAVVGKAMDISGQALQQCGVDLSVPAIIEGLVERVVNAMNGAIPWLPGAERLLEDLARADVPCALVTMALNPIPELVAAAAPQDVFRVVVTGGDVSAGKPHPEPYLKAAAGLNIDPVRCVAVEDSPSGTRSAEAAGMPVIVLPGVVPVPAGANRHFAASLADLSVVGLRAMIAPHVSK